MSSVSKREKSDVIHQVKTIYDYISQHKEFANLVPEVRMNISGAIPDAQDKKDIAAIEGRITVINGYPYAAGDIKFGVSDHTARLVLTAKQFDETINFVINLRYKPHYIEKIQESTTLSTFEFIRDTQPDTVKKKEHSTMQWLIKDCVKSTGQIPDIIWDRGGIGKEPIIRVFARDDREMIDKLKRIQKAIFG